MEKYIVKEREEAGEIEYIINVWREWHNIYSPAIADITWSIGIDPTTLKTIVINGLKKQIRDGGINNLRDALEEQGFVEEEDFDIKEESLIFYNKERAMECIANYLEPRRLALEMANGAR